MYNSFEIRNFRGLADVCIQNLQRVTLIAGENNIGKTALLEALWLHHGPNVPDLAVRVNSFRGLGQIDLAAPFSDLFTEFDSQKKIRLAAYGTWGERPRILAIGLEEQKEVEIPVSEPSLPIASTSEQNIPTRSSRYELVFEYTNEDGKQFRSFARPMERQVTPVIIELGVISHREPIGRLGSGIFLAANRLTGKDDIDRFSRLELARRQDELIIILQLIDRRIKRLSVVVQSREPVLYADIGLDRLVPMALLGGGMSRLLSIALAISDAKDGIILIDEIENGIYHGAMADIWKAIGIFARSMNAQVFATTHSLECIESAFQAFSKHEPFDFCLHRLERTAVGIRAVTYDKETLGAALEAGLEVR